MLLLLLVFNECGKDIDDDDDDDGYTFQPHIYTIRPSLSSNDNV